uniref:F-box domain-containing protein n=1 Tax=Oryza nivara TaxID=4536 RepID=A0A0E0I222_ORYNI
MDGPDESDGHIGFSYHYTIPPTQPLERTPCRGSSAPVGQPPQTLDPSPHVFRRHSSSPTKLECERASVSGGSDRDGDAAYECPDCISSLAAVLLHHILVFLPVVEAIRNCVLSHCWVCVWTGIPQLQLDDDAWRVDLLELIVEKKHHTLDPTIVHLLKKSKWTKRFSLKICPKKIHIHASPTAIVANRQTVGIKRSRWARLKN